MTHQYVIVTGGKVRLKQLKQFSEQNDLKNIIWIAADSGAEKLLTVGITPDILVGDLDSISPKVLDYLKQEGQTEIFRFPAEKDFSDTYLALQAISILQKKEAKALFTLWQEYHLPANCSCLCSKLQKAFCVHNTCVSEEKKLIQVDIFGANGSRLDHSMANFLIAFSFLEEMNIRFYLKNGHAYLCQGKAELLLQPDPKYPYISIVPLSAEISGITLSGFCYPLKNAIVKQGNASLLLSNQICSEYGRIWIESGKALIFQVKDC